VHIYRSTALLAHILMGSEPLLPLYLAVDPASLSADMRTPSADVRLKNLSADRNKEFFLLVQTLLNQQTTVVTSNILSYFTPDFLDDETKTTSFRQKTARMNLERQRCFMDVVDVDANSLVGCVGAIKVNRVKRCAQLMLIIYQEHTHCSAKAVRDLLTICRANPYNLRYITVDVSGPFVSPEFIAGLRLVGFYDVEAGEDAETDIPKGQWLVCDLDGPHGETIDYRSASPSHYRTFITPASSPSSRSSPEFGQLRGYHCGDIALYLRQPRVCLLPRRSLPGLRWAAAVLRPASAQRRRGLAGRAGPSRQRSGALHWREGRAQVVCLLGQRRMQVRGPVPLRAPRVWALPYRATVPADGLPV
jgi:hypothetical protein